MLTPLGVGFTCLYMWAFGDASEIQQGSTTPSFCAMTTKRKNMKKIFLITGLFLILCSYGHSNPRGEIPKCTKVTTTILLNDQNTL